MIMDLNEIVRIIEEIAPQQNAAAWDNSGIQVASHKTSVQCLAVCLDPTPQLVGEAIRLGADCILSHHPLALTPSLPSRLDDYHEVLRLLLGADIPLYAAHTSLDSNPAGPAGWLAKELSLQCVEVLAPISHAASSSAGFGLVGNLSVTKNFTEIKRELQQFISFETATVCGEIPANIHRVAYCTGSGGSMSDAAHGAGADLYITGDIKYHTALNTKIAILDVGHHSLEEEMMRRMAKTLQDKNIGIKIVFIPSVSPFRRLDA